jgi:hypothetical protein
MNVLAYIIYLVITYIITFRVGLLFYRNGRIYILHLLHNNEQLTDFINRVLLIGYYLLNLGYAALMISSWRTIYSIEVLIVSVITMIGRIMLTLALIHFLNMTIIYFVGTKHKYFNHYKK